MIRVSVCGQTSPRSSTIGSHDPRTPSTSGLWDHRLPASSTWAQRMCSTGHLFKSLSYLIREWSDHFLSAGSGGSGGRFTETNLWEPSAAWGSPARPQAPKFAGGKKPGGTGARERSRPFLMRSVGGCLTAPHRGEPMFWYKPKYKSGNDDVP